jgi:hypothetical protein
MRLRLFARLRRIVSWRSPDHNRGGTSRGATPDSRFREDSGRHRRNSGVARDQGQWTAQPPPPVGFQPPAGLQPPAGRRPGPGQPGVTAVPGGPAAPRNPAPRNPAPRSPAPPNPAPRNHGPRAGAERPAGGGGVGRARIREIPFGAAPMEQVTFAPEAHRQTAEPAMPRQPWYQTVTGPAGTAALAHSAAPPGATAAPTAEAAAMVSPPLNGSPPHGIRAARAARRAALPFAAPHPKGYPPTADGRRNCGPLEAILWRQWDAAMAAPPPQVITAIDRLAELPRALQDKLAAGLDGIYVGDGGVPDLDDMAALHGVPLPSGRATWDACAGAYGERKIVVGSRPSPTPDVICHEVGHALDDLDSPPGKWQSDSAEFRMIYDQCQPYIASDFHRQRGGLGRKEFFADAFAAIASAQRPALVDMLSGNTRIALRVMLYFNRRYGI